MTDDYDPYAPRTPRRSTRSRETAEALSEEPPSGPQTVAAGQLRSLIERVERLEEEKKTIGEDIRDVYAEAKGNGFDTKAIRAIVKLRKMDQGAREEAEAILDLYKSALGMA